MFLRNAGIRLQDYTVTQLRTPQFEVIAIETSKLIIEPKTTYRKQKESAHVTVLDHLINKPSLDISPNWTLVITTVVNKLQLGGV
jgi:hypothetical protein